ncbi:MAG: helix-turn-helix transcriptional regulator [Anaerolineae bacterium]|nr:helix-turn-helix transcriptional regulator [Anaerolineae bacterium]
MTAPPGFRLNLELLGKRVREKRGKRSLREISAELDIGIAVLSRVENAKLLPDYHNFGVLCHWLGDHPGEYFIINDEDTTDPLTTQLRAAKNMSLETATAFAEIIRAAYEQVLEQTAKPGTV